MTLSARLNVLILFLLASSAGIVLLLKGYETSLIERRLEASAARDQRAAWSASLHRLRDAFRVRHVRALEDGRLASALASRDRGGDGAFLESARRAASAARVEDDSGPAASLVEIYSADGGVAYSSSSSLVRRSLLDEATRDRVLAGGDAFGFGYDSENRLTFAAAFPIRSSSGGSAGYALYGASAETLLRSAAGTSPRGFVMVNRRGRVLAASSESAASRWRGMRSSVRLPTEDFQEVESEERFWSVLPFLETRFFGALRGWVAAMSDVTEERAALRRFENAYWAVLGAFAIVVMMAARGVLSSALAPLRDGVAILSDLSRGKAGGSLGERFADDEVGRILSAVERLRVQTIELQRLRHGRERHQTRTRALIRAEMENLAETLDDSARGEIIRDLAEVERLATRRGEATSEGGVGEGRELLAIALAFGKMGSRIRDKQTQLNAAIESLRKALETQAAYMSLQKELDIARKVQLSFVPDTRLQSETYDVAALMHPAKSVGGDFYDYFPLEGDRIGFVIGDVSDKGVPAALFMMVSRIVLQVLALSGQTPGETLERVNEILNANNSNAFFVTLFYGELNLRDGSLAYASAGHNPPYVLSAGASPRPLDATGDLVVGIMPDQRYQTRTLTLSPGDSVFVYTDGVNEAMDAEHGIFGYERLERALATLPQGFDASQAISGVLEKVYEFVKNAEQSDDVTCLAIQFRAYAEADADSVDSADASDRTA